MEVIIKVTKAINTDNMLVNVIQFIGLSLLMLVTGVFWGTWLSLSRSIEEISAETFLENGRWFIKNLARPMQILMPLTILVMILGMLVYPDKSESGFYLNMLAFILFIATLLITLIVEVPIDRKIEIWTVSTLPVNWMALRHKWQKYHTLRTFICIASFLLFAAGILFH